MKYEGYSVYAQKSDGRVFIVIRINRLWFVLKDPFTGIYCDATGYQIRTKFKFKYGDYTEAKRSLMIEATKIHALRKSKVHPIIVKCRTFGEIV